MTNQTAPLARIIGPRTSLARAVKQMFDEFATGERVSIVHNLRLPTVSAEEELRGGWAKLAAATDAPLIVIQPDGDPGRQRELFIGRHRFDLDAIPVSCDTSAMNHLGRRFVGQSAGLFKAIKQLVPDEILRASDRADWLAKNVLHSSAWENEAWLPFLRECLESDDALNIDAYYFLLLATMDETRWQHDQSNLEKFETLEPEAFGKLQLRKLVRNRLEDLRQACENPPSAADTILIIDDDRKQRESIQDLLKAFHGTECPVEYWDAPATILPKTPWKVSRRSFTEYRSDDEAMRCEFKHDVKAVEATNDERVVGTLPWLATWPRFVLVDQLYKDRGDQKGQSLRDGPALIRGLRRFFDDARRLGCASPAPEIIAVSQSDNPEHIQDALRAGARDFVVKRNLARLLAVLGNLRDFRITAEERDFLSFASLERLPSRTLGVVRSIRIPPVDCNRGKRTTAGASSEHPSPKADKRAAEVESTWPEAKGKWLDFLRAIPKAELHVHAGSCMSLEFLAFASFFGLMLDRNDSEVLAAVFTQMKELFRYGKVRMLDVQVAGRATGELFSLQVSKAETMSSVPMRLLVDLATPVVKAVSQIITPAGTKKSKLQGARLRQLRSRLHSELRIRDHLSDHEALSAFGQLASTEVLAFAFRNSNVVRKWSDGEAHGSEEHAVARLSTESFIRLLILALSGQEKLARIAISPKDDEFRQFRDVFLLRSPSQPAQDQVVSEDWSAQLGGSGDERPRPAPLSVDAFRRRNWTLPDLAPRKGEVPFQRYALPGWMRLEPIKHDLLRVAIATGKASRNLREYLDGCELSGALHLKHPFLCHLYAQQNLHHWVSEGIAYSELRASPDGYVNKSIDFGFPDVVRCFAQAFGSARACLMDAPNEGQNWLPDILFGEQRGRQQKVRNWTLAKVAEPLKKTFRIPRTADPDRTLRELLDGRLLPTVGLLFVGKRHKPMGEMIHEVSAVLVEGSRSFRTIVDGQDTTPCPIVGFDLAGQEPEYPPQLFAAEFKRLGQSHVPITVHAGENAPAAFVESAILDLGARRIGHALSLAENSSLMDRMRDVGICVELCPTSNDQTCNFAAPGKPGRQYPLKEYVVHGIPVTINTDNPVISDTRLSNEFFQASYFWGGKGMSLWTALSVIKNGFTHAFVPLPVRRELVERVEERIFDLLDDYHVRNWMQEELARASIEHPTIEPKTPKQARSRGRKNK